MKPTLLILAAGMGSRYGGLKQLDGFGPNGETIMDYSVFDALRAGFGRVVFVIRRSFEEQFRRQVLSRYAGHVPVEVVFQELDALPEGYDCPNERTRPWGTGHAVMMGSGVINEPFAVINSDDFYGFEAFESLARYLSGIQADEKGRYAMVAFKVGNTTTRNGTVSRGVCTVDNDGCLTKIVECHHIGYDADGNIEYKDADGQVRSLEADTPVSMNFWGFTPDYFEHSDREFRRFLDKYINEQGREFYIPSVVDKLRGNGQATVDVLNTHAQWFGVTYGEDREGVKRRLHALHEAGVYPKQLFE